MRLLRDQFHERTVAADPGKGPVVRIVVGCVLVIAGLVLLKFSRIATLAAVVIGILLIVYASPQLHLEYDYELTNGDLDISAVYAKNKRETVRSVTADQVQKIAPVSEPAVQNDLSRKGAFSLEDYRGKTPDQEMAVYVKDESGESILLLDLNQECVDHLKTEHREKFV